MILVRGLVSLFKRVLDIDNDVHIYYEGGVGYPHIKLKWIEGSGFSSDDIRRWSEIIGSYYCPPEPGGPSFEFEFYTNYLDENWNLKGYKGQIEVELTIYFHEDEWKKMMSGEDAAPNYNEPKPIEPLVDYKPKKKKKKVK